MKSVRSFSAASAGSFLHSFRQAAELPRYTVQRPVQVSRRQIDASSIRVRSLVVEPVSSGASHASKDDSLKQPMLCQDLVTIIDIAFSVFRQQYELIVMQRCCESIGKSHTIRVPSIQRRFDHDGHGTGWMRNTTVRSLDRLPRHSLCAH